MRRLIPLLTLALFAGCASNGTAEVDRDTDGFLEAADYVYEINVYPNRDANDPAALLPQSFFVASGGAVGMELAMSPPIQLSGVVNGYLVTPRGLDLPGQDVAVAAEIGLLLEDTIQSRYAATNSDGSYALSVVPGSAYTLTVRPESASFPFLVESIDLVDDVVVDFHLDPGVAIWGQVVGPTGQPIAGTRVAAVGPLGIRGEPTVTDASGRYSLRVQPGTYSVMVLGRDTGRDPSLTTPPVQAGEAGRRVDIQYSNLSLVTVGGRATVAGTAVGGARVRFTAESLFGYEDVTATAQVEAVANASGNFDTRLIPGVYTLEVLPTSSQSATVRTLTEVVVDGDTDLGVVALDPFRSFERGVFDNTGTPLPGAGIRCTEQAGDGRSVTATSGADGRFQIALPQSEVVCLITPQGGSGRLASARVEIDVATEDLPPIALQVGATVSGHIVVSGMRSADTGFALIEVRDSKGSLWGTALTDNNGRFSLQVGWPLP